MPVLKRPNNSAGMGMGAKCDNRTEDNACDLHSCVKDITPASK